MQSTPSPRRFRAVADKLEARILGADRFLRMESPLIEKDPDCGTVACLAGHWLDIRRQDADFQEISDKELRTINPEETEDLPSDELAPWLMGKEIFARDLGFDRAQDLIAFASQNPKLWGNHDGSRIFLSLHAWTSKANPITPTLMGIVQHLRLVAGNLERETAGA